MMKHFTNINGFTLPEILITLVISGITAIAAGSIVVWITGLTSFLMDKNLAEQNLMLAAYRLKSTIALAINVGNNGTPGNSLCTGANLALQGGGCFVKSYTLTGQVLNGQVDTLARFYRETGTYQGQMVETAIFFRRPDITNL